MTFDLPRRLAAEAVGTAMLVATVVGSGIMADLPGFIMAELAGAICALAFMGWLLAGAAAGPAGEPAE